MTTTTAASDVLTRLEKIRPIIEEHATQGEIDRELAQEVYDAFRASGLNRLGVPAALGGLEVDPVDAIALFEAMGAIDGSAAWVLNQQYAVSSILTWMRDGLEEIFADPDGALSGVFWPPGSAERVDGGYRITSRVGFASGVARSSWFLAPAVVMVDGEPVIDASTGGPDMIAVAIPTAEVTVLDTWNALGMRATGSNDVLIEGVVVPDRRVAHIFALPARPASLAAPGYGLVPWQGVHAHAAVPLGIARGALEHSLRLAIDKVPNFMQVPLKEREYVQTDLAKAKAAIESASVYLRTTMRAALDAVDAGTFGPNQQIDLQLAANQAAASAEEAMRLVHHCVGTTTVRDEAGMGRRFRDLSTITQHASIQPGRWASTGKVMFGLESDWFPFAL
ncbi:MAG: acyl-CoA dehydrogenase family protein [Vicinamibacterales bacterium]